ncbi:MAG: hypothetical protein MJ107_07210, partial [Lachnospiraceae bacterium]|nr:hypothetical protein [Lachnospiraceae bacterium]
KKKYVRGYGCGVVACANVLLHTAERPDKNLSVEEYTNYARKLRHRYLPVIPKFGMNGVFMAIGFDLCLRLRHTGMRAHWGCLKKNIFSHIERMLSEDIPVVLSIGPNWPNLWGNHRLKMYFRTSDGYREATTTRAHYVTVTAMDEVYMEVSSWGKKYYVNKNEYLEYIKKHSNALFSSILVVRKKG